MTSAWQSRGLSRMIEPIRPTIPYSIRYKMGLVPAAVGLVPHETADGQIS